MKQSYGGEELVKVQYLFDHEELQDINIRTNNAHTRDYRKSVSIFVHIMSQRCHAHQT